MAGPSFFIILYLVVIHHSLLYYILVALVELLKFTGVQVTTCINKCYKVFPLTLCTLLALLGDTGIGLQLNTSSK
jgi:hypothetical protein